MKTILGVLIGILGLSISDVSIADTKVCAFDSKKFDLTTTEQLKAELEDLNCVKGDRILIWETLKMGAETKRIRTKFIGAQICNFDKYVDLGGSVTNYKWFHGVCEYSGEVLEISVKDKNLMKALK